MIEDKTNGALDKIKEFAKTVGKEEQLQEKLDYLGDYGLMETKCVLQPDFAPHSLNFTLLRKEDDEWKYWFNGGLVFHGSHDGYGGGGGPTFSTCLEPTDGWSVHT